MKGVYERALVRGKKKLTEEERKQRQRQAGIKWRLNNPDKVKEFNRKKRQRKYDPEKRREWYRKRIESDPIYKRKLAKQSNDRATNVREWLDVYKLVRGCADCGYKEHPAALQFDHVTGKKKLNVCNSKSIEQAKNEIKKCEVVCANCHFIRTAKRIGKRHKENLVMKFKTISVEVDAVQLKGRMTIEKDGLTETSSVGEVGDWLITEKDGRQYFCKDSIFQKTYEKAEETSPLIPWNPYPWLPGAPPVYPDPSNPFPFTPPTPTWPLGPWYSTWTTSSSIFQTGSDNAK